MKNSWQKWPPLKTKLSLLSQTAPPSVPLIDNQTGAGGRVNRYRGLNSYASVNLTSSHECNPWSPSSVEYWIESALIATRYDYRRRKYNYRRRRSPPRGDRFVDAIVHEDLRSLSPRGGEGQLSWELSSWARREIIENIEFRADIAGLHVERVRPGNTSRSCPPVWFHRPYHEIARPCAGSLAWRTLRVRQRSVWLSSRPGLRWCGERGSRVLQRDGLSTTRFHVLVYRGL